MEEIISFIKDIKELRGKTFVDCTLGEGGHSELILKTFKDIKIIGFERDQEILEISRKRLRDFGNRITFINDNFSNISEHLDIIKKKISLFLYDFGISSFHLEMSKRGFSLQRDEILDMRLDLNCKVDARYIINKFPENQLRDLIFDLGEERWAKRIARYICTSRAKNPIETTLELSTLILKAIPRRYHVKNIHPATRVFQAIRIAVNDELSCIDQSLKSVYNYLIPGGRIIAISFHSLEDRIVKNRFKKLKTGCICDLDHRICQCERNPLVKILTKKPLLPEESEILRNKRSRSAKLRVCEKI